MWLVSDVTKVLENEHLVSLKLDIKYITCLCAFPIIFYGIHYVSKSALVRFS